MAFFDSQVANMTKLHAAKMDQTYGQARYAIVKEYDPETNLVIVAYYNPETDEDELLSGWLPLLVPYIGLGDDTEAGDGEPWGIVYPPNIGQRVIVMCQGGDFNNGLVVGGSYSDISPVPTDDEGALTEDGEFLIKHKSGTTIKLYNNGDVKVFAKRDLILNADRDINMHSKRDMNIQVDRNLHIVVEGDMSETVFGGLDENIIGDAISNFSGNFNRNITGNIVEGINGTFTQAINGRYTVGTNGVLTLTSRTTNFDAGHLNVFAEEFVAGVRDTPWEDF